MSLFICNETVLSYVYTQIHIVLSINRTISWNMSMSLGSLIFKYASILKNNPEMLGHLSWWGFNSLKNVYTCSFLYVIIMLKYICAIGLFCKNWFLRAMSHRSGKLRCEMRWESISNKTYQRWYVYWGFVNIT